MKALFFVLSLTIGCAEDKEHSTTEGEVESTDEIENDTQLDPVGIILGDDCQHIDIGDKPCNFRLTDQNGDTWDLYEHEGDVILLDFSTMWCYPCQMAGQHTQGIQDDYEGEGFQFVTVLIDGYTHSTEPTTEEIGEWAYGHSVTSAPVLQGSRDKMLDSTGTGIEGYLLSGFPTYIYIGRDMKFYAGHVGYSEEYIHQKIQEGL